MTKKIDQLTPDQEAQTIAFREEWRSIGLATGPANIEAVRGVIENFYSRIGKAAPYIWRCESPRMAQLVMSVLSANLGDNLGDNLRANLWANLGDNLRANLWANLGANLGANLWANLGANLRANLEYISTWLWGSLDAYWIAYYLYPHVHLRSMHTDDQMHILGGWETLARNCFWWYPFANICFVCDRPTYIGMDAQWRMHADGRAAVEFSDGWKLYAVHGVMVPVWVIETPDQITTEKIDVEENAEVRRVMMARYGWKNYCEQKGAKLISKHSNDIFGELWEFQDKDHVKVQFVHVRNGTPEPDGSYKWYDLRVRPRFTNVVDAVASTYPGMSREEFDQISQFRS